MATWVWPCVDSRAWDSRVVVVGLFRVSNVFSPCSPVFLSP